MDLRTFKQTVFNHELSQEQKLALMEQLFEKDINHNFPDLSNILDESFDKKDIHVMGYCLAKSDDFDLEKLFLLCCEKGFLQGAQLLSYQIDLPHHPKKSTLLSEGFIKSANSDDVQTMFDFLIKKGGDVNEQENFIFRHAYECSNTKVLSLLIQIYRIPKTVLHFILEKDTNTKRVDWINEQYKILEKTIEKEKNLAPITIPKPLPKVLHRKI